MDTIMSFIKDLGIAGLLISMFLEGSSLPFQGIAAVLYYGFVLKPSIWETVTMGLMMSLIYSLASFIPYFIGIKAETYLQKKLKKS